MSFIDTWSSAQLTLALARYVHTSVIAVQGASARIIIPIMYSLCNFSGIKEEKITDINNQAIKVITKGWIPQFMVNVKAITFAFFLRFNSSEYFTFSIIGYIIINSTIAIGSETFANSISDKEVDSQGKKYPIKVPDTIQITTHIERYLLNVSSSFWYIFEILGSFRVIDIVLLVCVL